MAKSKIHAKISGLFCEYAESHIHAQLVDINNRINHFTALKNSTSNYNDICAYNSEVEYLKACKSYITNNNKPIPDGYMYCPECEECHKIEEMNILHINYYHMSYICNDCVDSGEVSFYCEHCDELHHIDEETFVNMGNYDASWCENCADEYAHVCDNCGTHISDNAVALHGISHNSGDDIYICDSCADDYRYCADCGEIISECYSYYCEEDENYYCGTCYMDHRPNYSAYLHNYGHTRANKEDYYMTGNENIKSLVLGIEIETEATSHHIPGKIAKRVIESVPDGLVVCKEDGSLDYGCEIVTMPLSPEFALTTNHIQDIVSACIIEGATSHDNGHCGLHIHINNKALKTMYGKFIVNKLINMFPEFWTKFSRRDYAELCRWARIENMPSMVTIESDNYDIVSYWNRKKRSGRYYAVNNNNENCDTTEIRLFRGSLNINTIKASIEAVSGIAIYAHYNAMDALNETFDIKSMNNIDEKQLCEIIISSLIKENLPWMHFAYYVASKNILSL